MLEALTLLDQRRNHALRCLQVCRSDIVSRCQEDIAFHKRAFSKCEEELQMATAELEEEKGCLHSMVEQHDLAKQCASSADLELSKCREKLDSLSTKKRSTRQMSGAVSSDAASRDRLLQACEAAQAAKSAADEEVLSARNSEKFLQQQVWWRF